MEERAAGRREHEAARIRAQFLEVGERSRVSVGIAAEADREVIAAVLALDADPAREPPDRRVIEEQRLDERLQQVDEVVVTTDVRELVREDRFELLRPHTRQRARRHQHDRSKPSDDGGNLDHRRLQQPNRSEQCAGASRGGRRSAATLPAPALFRANAGAGPTASPRAAGASGQPHPTARRGARRGPRSGSTSAIVLWLRARLRRLTDNRWRVHDVGPGDADGRSVTRQDRSRGGRTTHLRARRRR